MFFSATMASEVAGLTRELLKNPAKITIERTTKPAAGVEQSFYPVPQQLKAPLLLNLIQSGDIKNALVFTRTKRRADKLAEFLKRANLSVTRIHGDRTQAQRLQALEGFKNGRYKILVATDVAARGIHVQALSHVINYDLPQSAEDYVHRVGRTARAQATGSAYSFVAPEDEGNVRAIERAISTTVQRKTVEGFDYKAPILSSGPRQYSGHRPSGGQRSGGGHRPSGGVDTDSGGGQRPGGGGQRPGAPKRFQSRPWARDGSHREKSAGSVGFSRLNRCSN